jgi:hypothetical protein
MAADGVPVPFDEHELVSAGQPGPDPFWHQGGDADGADLVAGVTDFAGGVQDRLVFPGMGVGQCVQPARGAASLAARCTSARRRPSRRPPALPA